MSSTVADQLLERLSQWGVKRVFGYPGDGINGIMGAMGRRARRPGARSLAPRFWHQPGSGHPPHVRVRRRLPREFPDRRPDLLVGPALADGPIETRSHLYHPGFRHEYRAAVGEPPVPRADTTHRVAR